MNRQSTKAQALPRQPDPDLAAPSPAPFCFHLFGELAITQKGIRLPPPPHCTQVLLAALLLYPRLWQREQLAGQLFPDAGEQRARQRLSHLLWQLRQWLPKLPLEATPQTLYLAPEARWLDVKTFRQAAADPEVASWIAALALYRGDLLEGIYDDWLLQEREALYLEYVRLSHRACDALWQQGRLEELLPLVAVSYTHLTLPTIYSV